LRLDKLKRLFRLAPIWLSAGLGVAYAQGENGPPQALVSMVDKILTLLQYIGVAVLVGGLIYAGIQLAVADTPEEQARAKKRVSIVILAGAIMALAKPIVSWLTGMTPP